MSRSVSKSIWRLLQRDLRADLPLRLVVLYRNWTEVAGEVAAELGRPLGHRDRTLVVGAEDSMAAQELVFHAPEMLERVNAFLGQEWFDKIQVELVMGRVPPGGVLERPALSRRAPDRPEGLGGLAGRLNPASPVGRCYAAYLRLFGGGGSKQQESGKDSVANKEQGG